MGSVWGYDVPFGVTVSLWGRDVSLWGHYVSLWGHYEPYGVGMCLCGVMMRPLGSLCLCGVMMCPYGVVMCLYGVVMCPMGSLWGYDVPCGVSVSLWGHYVSLWGDDVPHRVIMGL